MLEDYLLIHKSLIPECYFKVLEAKKLLEVGRAKDVSQAVRQVGISRSTYYKYKDAIMEPSDMNAGRKAVLSMILCHEAGSLSKLLSVISGMGANVLTITQSLPIHDRASVTLSIDIAEMSGSVEDLMEHLRQSKGTEHVRLVAIE